MKEMTEKEKFGAWLDKEREENGLVDFHFSIDPLKDTSPESAEEIYKELNEAVEAMARGESVPFVEGDLGPTVNFGLLDGETEEIRIERIKREINARNNWCKENCQDCESCGIC